MVFNYIFFPTLALVVMYIVRDSVISGTRFSIGAYAIPGILAMNVLFTGLMGLATGLLLEREDGTLLRAKATPNGVLGYLVGKVTCQAAMALTTLFAVLIVAAALFDGLHMTNPMELLRFIWIVPLGLAATLPFGAVLGSILPNPRQLSFVSLFLMGLTSVSGVFYPLGLQPLWMQIVGQAFPLYWLGLGMRSAMLPDEMVVAEIGQTWWSVETVVVLGLWSLLGAVVALRVLRRAARRESGTRLRSMIT
ncbi:ABC transporter permease [Nocardia transvalensis]|uniref:ABC transporter permease n=1 Tax=Nocardia transvalensis TaxID=37333 RepID=UPI001E2C30AB|nr:ABC transporter permease [Nocardia transvalensis]